jgi:TctA family transporter
MLGIFFMSGILGIIALAANAILTEDRAPLFLLGVFGTVFILLATHISTVISQQPDKARCEILKGQFLEGTCYKATEIKLPE